MALTYSLNCKNYHKPFAPAPTNPNFKCNLSQFSVRFQEHRSLASSSTSTVQPRPRRCFCVVNEGSSDDDEENSLGVKTALSMLKFYKREISPLMPNSCRYVPTCSEYSMIAYKKYGVVKGTVLTAWRLCRCNPLGGSGFDPPRWFDESTSPEK